MDYARVFFMVVVALITWAAGIEAQSKSDTLDPLSPPAGQMLICKSLPVTPDDSADVVLQFMDGGESLGERKTTIAYDAAGTPLSLVLSTEGSTAPGQGMLHIIIIRFQPTAEGAHGTLDERQAGLMAPEVQDGDFKKSLPPGWNKTTPEEISRARDLAVDIWKRRCGKPVESGLRPANPSSDSIH
jgi:hypothetical protein